MSTGNQPQNRLIAIGGTIIAVIGFVATIVGLGSDILGFVGKEEEGISEEDMIATIVALQDDKIEAELQLTQIFLSEQSSANQATQSAVETAQANFQATLDTIQAEQEAVIATQNALAVLTSTADAINAEATEVAANMTATADFIAQVTPTATPQPTVTPTPVPVIDHRNLSAAEVTISGSSLIFSVRTEQPIPKEPQEGLSYVWSLDTDGDPETGSSLRGLGIDARVRIRYENETWIGVVKLIQPDGEEGETFYFLDISVNGANLSGTVDTAEIALPQAFHWVVRAELGDQVYSFLPSGEEDFFTLGSVAQ